MNEIIKGLRDLQGYPLRDENVNIPYILEYNMHPNLIRTQVLAIS
jgi:hypothetical protein